MDLETKINQKLAELRNRKSLLLEYLDDRRACLDLHGVEDAASDCRDVSAAIEALEGILEL